MHTNFVNGIVSACFVCRLRRFHETAPILCDAMRLCVRSTSSCAPCLPIAERRQSVPARATTPVYRERCASRPGTDAHRPVVSPRATHRFSIVSSDSSKQRKQKQSRWRCFGFLPSGNSRRKRRPSRKLYLSVVVARHKDTQSFLPKHVVDRKILCGCVCSPVGSTMHSIRSSFQTAHGLSPSRCVGVPLSPSLSVRPPLGANQLPCCVLFGSSHTLLQATEGSRCALELVRCVFDRSCRPNRIESNQPQTGTPHPNNKNNTNHQMQ